MKKTCTYEDGELKLNFSNKAVHIYGKNFSIIITKHVLGFTFKLVIDSFKCSSTCIL